MDYKCEDFIPEANCPYPLCDNPNCPDKFRCCISANMKEDQDD